jgi:hypothetical protein
MIFFRLKWATDLATRGEAFVTPNGSYSVVVFGPLGMESM